MDTKTVIAVRKDQTKVSAKRGWNIMTADEIDEMFRKKPDAVKKLDLRCVETGATAIFTFAIKGEGFKKTRRAHFRHVAGEAPAVSHIFDKKQSYRNINDALADEAKILLNLNLRLPYEDSDFSKMRDSSIVALNQWKLNNKYFSVSIKNIGDALKVASRVNKLGGNANDDVFISSQNAVRPFDEIFIGQDKPKLEKLRDDLESGECGMVKDETRVIGAEQAIHFSPTQTTWDDNGVGIIKGNYQKHSNGENAILSYLIFSERDDEKQKIAKAQAMEIFRQNPQHIYILACPTISVGYQEDKGYFKNIRWIINDVADQIVVAPEARALNLTSTTKAQPYAPNAMPTQQLSLIK